jgi:hypothetical protein
MIAISYKNMLMAIWTLRHGSPMLAYVISLRQAKQQQLIRIDLGPRKLFKLKAHLS